MSSKSFQSHQSTAIERQDVARVALENVFNINQFTSFEDNEYESNKEFDTQGIDAQIETDDGLKFVAIKTRSSYKRNVEDLDIGLRVAGRNRNKSSEWERFISDSKKVPHVLVYITLDKKEEVQEILVIDFKELKHIYKMGVQRNRLMYNFGKVDFYNNPISTDIYNASYDSDDGIFTFLDITDIRNLSCVKYHMQKDVDFVGFE